MIQARKNKLNKLKVLWKLIMCFKIIKVFFKLHMFLKMKIHKTQMLKLCLWLKLKQKVGFFLLLVLIMKKVKPVTLLILMDNQRLLNFNLTCLNLVCLKILLFIFLKINRLNSKKIFLFYMTWIFILFIIKI